MKNTWIKHRVPLTVVAILLIALLWYVVVYAAQTSHFAAVSSERNDIAGQLRAAEQKLGEAGSVYYGLRRAEGRWGDIEGRLVAPDSADQIVRRVEHMAEACGLSVQSSRLDFSWLIESIVGDPKNGASDRIGITVEGRGSFFSVGAFLDSLQQEPLISDLQNVVLSYDEHIDPDIYFEVEARAFVLPEGGKRR